MTRILIVLLFALCCSACSQQQWYYALQEAETSECVNEPANQYQECLARQDMEYDEYAALRGQEMESH